MAKKNMRNLIRPYKDLIDKGNLALLAAVDISYLTEEEQKLILKICEDQKVEMKLKLAELFRRKSGELTEQVVEEILEIMVQKKKPASAQIKLSSAVCEKYMKGTNEEQMMEVMEQALVAWFDAGKGMAHVWGRTVIRSSPEVFQHQHGRARTLRQAVKGIQRHDEW